jgi:hypothetical protein
MERTIAFYNVFDEHGNGKVMAGRQEADETKADIIRHENHLSSNTPPSMGTKDIEFFYVEDYKSEKEALEAAKNAYWEKMED